MDQAIHLVRGMSGTWVGQRLTGWRPVGWRMDFSSDSIAGCCCSMALGSA